MNKLFFLFTLIFSLSFFSSKSNAEWTKISESTSGNVSYVDFDTIRKHKGYTYYWTLTDMIKPLNNYLSGKRYMQGDCGVFRYKQLTFSFHLEPMGRGKGDVQEPVGKNKNWIYPEPGTVGGSVLNSVCKSK